MSLEDVKFPSIEETETPEPGFKHPAPLPHLPGHPHHCAKPSFTLQEDFFETTKKVHETLRHVLELKENIKRAFETYTQSLTADNADFKNVCINTYNEFSQAVTNEINNFENSMLNRFELFEETISNENADFLTNYEAFKNEVHNICDNFNSAHEQAFNDFVTQINAKINANDKANKKAYEDFTNAVNGAFTTYKNEVNKKIDLQNARIEDIDHYCRTNFIVTLENILNKCVEDGTFSEILTSEVLSNMATKEDLTANREESNTLYASKNELEIEKTRISQHIATQDTGTNSTEIIDGRISWDGHLYDTIGDSIRATQFLIANIGTMGLTYYSANNRNKYINYSTGNEVDYDIPLYHTSDLVDVSEFSGANMLITVTPLPADSNAGLAFYDKNENYIRGQRYDGGSGKGTKTIIVPIPKTAHYMKVTALYTPDGNSHNYPFYPYRSNYDLNALWNEVHHGENNLDHFRSSELPCTLKTGYYISYHNGVSTDFGDTSLSITDYIPVKPYGKIKISNLNFKHEADNRGMAFYDSSKNFIAASGIVYPSNCNEFETTIPRNASYVRFTTNTNYTPTITHYYSTIFEALENFHENTGIYEVINNSRMTLDTLDYEHKNLLQLTPGETVKNGVTCTINSDGSVVVNGTATANAVFDVVKSKLSPGIKYTLSGCPSGGSDSTYKLYNIFTSSWVLNGSDVGNGVDFIGSNQEIATRITIYKGATVNNLTFYPMIRYAGTSPEFVPYNKTIGERLNAIESELDIDTRSYFNLSENPGFLSCFPRVAVIGDSLSAGECVSNDTGAIVYNDNHDYSWGKYLEKATGNNWTICARGGETTSTVQSYSAFNNLMENITDYQCIFLALGVNDYTDGVAVGEFFENYNHIIDNINNAFDSKGLNRPVIFTLTSPEPGMEDDFNLMISSCAQSNVYCLDLAYNCKKYTGSEFLTACRRGPHFNAIGYKYISMIISSYVNYVIKRNPDLFSQIEFIGTTKKYN